ncbi:MAG: competence/damage-inducible protein A [Thermoanaerobaculia bacterium]
MKASILAVGSELLRTDRLDTNSLILTGALEKFGVELISKGVVGDSIENIVSAVANWVDRVDLLLITGGLGPTSDDVTRYAVAQALGRGLAMDESIVADIQRKFEEFGLSMPAVNRRQAEVIDGARVLENPQGTAPGMRLESDDCTLFLFPGVPKELRRMVDSALVTWLHAHSKGESLESRVIRVSCLAESTVEEKLAPVYREFGRAGITLLAAPGDVQIQLTARGSADEIRQRLDSVESRVEELLSRAVYGKGEGASLEKTVGEMLRRTGTNLIVAESCTGGLLAERLTAIPGSSEYFVGAAVTYSNDLKTALLKVPPAVLDSNGAVSEEVARAMAEGARRLSNVDFGVSVTGVAGPGGGSKLKPVGTVYVAVAGPAAGECLCRKFQLPGDRKQVRWLASQWALELLRRRLLSLVDR